MGAASEKPAQDAPVRLACLIMNLLSHSGWLLNMVVVEHGALTLLFERVLLKIELAVNTLTASIGSQGGQTGTLQESKEPLSCRLASKKSCPVIQAAALHTDGRHHTAGEVDPSLDRWASSAHMQIQR